MKFETLEKWLFYIFIFFIPIQIRYIFATWTTRFNEWTAGFVYLTDILLIVLLILWGIRCYNHSIRPKLYSIDYFLLIFIAVAGVSIIGALEPAVSWFRYIKLIEYIFLFWYIRSNTGTISKRSILLGVVILSGFMQAIIGIIQSLIQSQVGLRLLGESPIIVGNPGVAVFKVNGDLFLRAYGTTPHPNVVALWLMFSVWAFAIWYCKDEDKNKPIIYSLLLAPLLLGFWMTFSRVTIGVWALSVIVVLFIMSFRKYYERHVFLFKRVLHLLGVTIFLSAFFVLLYWPQIQARIHIEPTEEAVTQRLFYNELAQGITADSPIFGVGIGQFVPKLMDQFKFYPSYIYQPVHNIYLLVSSEMGIIGLIVFIIILYLSFVRSFYLRKNVDANIITILFVSVLLIGLFDHFLLTMQQGSLMLWIIIGIMSRDGV